MDFGEELDFNTICRTCLGTKHLNPLFKKTAFPHRFSKSLFKVTGLKVGINDGLPQNICKKCLQLIRTTITFQWNCKKVERKLKMQSHYTNFIVNKYKEINSNKDTEIELENNCELNLKTEISVKEFSKLGTDFFNPLPIVGMVNKKEVKSEDINEKIFNYEFEKKYDFVETHEHKYERENNTPIKTEYIEENKKYLYKKFENVHFKDKKTSEINLSRSKLNKKQHKSNKTKKLKKRDIIKDDDLANPTHTINAHEKCIDPVIYIEEKFEIKTKNNLTINHSLNCTDKLNPISADFQDQKITCEELAGNTQKQLNENHSAVTEKMQCQLCEEYIMKEKLEVHVLMEHTVNHVSCKFCQQLFESPDTLVKHVPACKSVAAARQKKLRSGVWGKETIECNLCSKKMQKASLKMHMKVKHAGLGPVCDHCGKKFSNKFRLNEHMRSKHGYAKFKCSQCVFESATTIGLANHERRHRGEKPFVCELCGASFHAAYLLTQHKHSHRTERLLKCDVCPASFKSNNGLHTHRAACHGVMRHACFQCQRAYSCRHYLVRHMRTVHRYFGAVPVQAEPQAAS